MIAITIARKPLPPGTVAKNLLTHGTGVLNVDSVRTPAGESWQEYVRQPNQSIGTFATKERVTKQHPDGRYPTNVVLLDTPQIVGQFPISDRAQVRSGWGRPCKGIGMEGKSFKQGRHLYFDYGDQGTAARFFKRVTE